MIVDATGSAARRRRPDRKTSPTSRWDDWRVTDWREIDDRIYVRRHESFDLNVGLVVAAGGCLVIDSREHLTAGRELAAAVREVTAEPWTVVNTHAHFDHFLGNDAFVPAPIWALDGTRAVIAGYGEVQRRIWAHQARRRGEDE